MPVAHVTIHPWDLLDEGVHVVLDRLQGQLGVTGVTLWVACGEVMQIRGRDIPPRIVRNDGGLLFPPNADRYTATRIRPTVAGRWKQQDFPAALAEQCRSRGLDLRFMVTAASIGRLAEKHPFAAAKNAFDDVSLRAVCLNHPDVREFLRALVMDLSSRYATAGVVLTHLVSAWMEAFDDQLTAPVRLADLDRFLLSLCFCESCQQGASSAGLEPTPTRRCVEVLLSRRMEGKAAGQVSIDTILEEFPILTAFIQWRDQELAGLLRRLAETAPGRITWDRSWHPPFAEVAPSAAPPEVTMATRVASLIEFDDYLPSLIPNQEIRFAHSLVCEVDGAELVRVASQSAERGVSGLTFDGYALWSEATVDAVRQAVRFARRTTH